MKRVCLALALFGAACGDSAASAASAMDSGAGGGAAHDDGGAGQSGADAGRADAGPCSYDPLAGARVDCPDDIPGGCPGPAPSYSAAVAPAVAKNCEPCHRAGGLAPDKPLHTHDQLFERRRTVLNRVSRCIMPPACAQQPSASERRDLLQWLVCGAPDN